MTDTYAVIDFLFSQFISIWGVVVATWTLSIPILLCIFIQLFYLIKGIYKK